MTRSFHVEGELGEGGFGTVLLARMEAPHGVSRRVALKLLRAEQTDEGQRARLRDEARLLAWVHHPVIVHGYDVVETDAGWAVVMEHVPGHDLAALAPVPARVALLVVAEIGDALDTLHRAVGPTGVPLGIVHRDVKPPNVRISPRGRIRLLDLGVARAALPSREAETRDRSYGTLRYMAPERLRGVELPAGDVYALAMTFSDALTGGVTAEDGAELRAEGAYVAILREHPSAPLGLLEQFCEELLAALDPDPEQRPAAADLSRTARLLYEQLGATDVRGWAEALPTPAPRPSSWTGRTLTEARGGSTKPAERRWSRVAIALAAAAVLGWWSTDSTDVPDPATAASAPEIERASTTPPGDVAGPEPMTEPHPGPPAAEAPAVVVAAGPTLAEDITIDVSTSDAPKPTGEVVFTGDVSACVVVDDTCTSGAVPSGTWRVHADFGEGLVDGQLSVEVREHEVATVRCVQEWRRCGPG